MSRIVSVGVALWLFSLMSAIAAVGLGDFGAPRWLVLLLLTWLVTLGAPTSAGVLAAVWWWPGGPLLAFAALAAGLALAAQLAAVWTASRLLRSLRGRPSRGNQPA